MTTPNADTTTKPPVSRLQVPTTVRLFHSTETQIPCRERAELFFNPHTYATAQRWCASCPFLGRCSYNAVATRATHGIWGGMVLPGHYRTRLAPIYARLAAQFENRRVREVGDVLVAPLPGLGETPDDDDELDTLAGLAA